MTRRYKAIWIVDTIASTDAFSDEPELELGHGGLVEEPKMTI